ncbi:hypothetical protein OIDMADRAFT_62500 [Oidiodendron maius Zn]|uniref:F-box domain-containing protein n=1 Tax=Oidiodendron maius (strain Zn) TaxID=913774 RepID=A0A0C3CS68_OIDMZ|nr:hypothetical protein OIDMADRAFT_62500 [Oidiodendron maius Zn]
MAQLLSPEVLDNIFQYIDVRPQQLLICRSWYHPIRRRLLRYIRLSPSTLFRIPILSDEFLELLYSYTRSIRIILNYSNLEYQESRRDYSNTFTHPVPYSEAWVYGINAALIELAQKIQYFRGLRSFTFCNFLEIESSWNIIYASTFENILSGLSNLHLEFVKIDFPGAELENRLQIYDSWVDKPHVCEIIAKNFPQSRRFDLRLREICSDLLQFKYTCRPLLETFIIDLNLEPNTRYQLDMDSFVLDCRFSERFGRSLLNVLVSDARKLSHCSQVPNINIVQFLCKVPDTLSEIVSYTEAEAGCTVALQNAVS